MRAIAGVNATDYADHVVSEFTDAASVYAAFHKTSEADVLSQIQ